MSTNKLNWHSGRGPHSSEDNQQGDLQGKDARQEGIYCRNGMNPWWVEDVEEEEELHMWNVGEEQQYEIADHLTKEHQAPPYQGALSRFKTFPRAVQEHPSGETKAVEHAVDTGTARPVKLPPYHKEL